MYKIQELFSKKEDFGNKAISPIDQGWMQRKLDEQEILEKKSNEIIEKAESLGWKDPDYLTNGQWTPRDVDNTEEDAIDFIKKEEGHNNV